MPPEDRDWPLIQLMHDRRSETSTAARRVLRTEIAGLEALVAGLDGSFSAAVEPLAAGARPRHRHRHGQERPCRAQDRRDAVASTGTPAQFVHPAEASHGDLGMIADGDAVLALSNSGDTAELADIVAYTRRFRIPLIAMTAARRQRAGRGRRCHAAAAGHAPRPARWVWRRPPRRR